MREQTVLDRARPRLADAFDLDEVGDARPHELRQVGEPLDDVLDDRVGKARDLREQPVAAGLDRRVEIGFAREVEHAGDGAAVDEVVVVDLGEAREHRADVVALAAHDVVARRRAAGRAATPPTSSSSWSCTSRPSAPSSMT